MPIGPFSTYVPPGVYTRTLTESNVASLIAGLRIPTVIGVGQEELEQDDLEMVRGSSATIDQQIVSEDVSLAWVTDETNPIRPVFGAQDGTRTKFRVRNFPLVDGQGIGKITNDVRSVVVTVNGTPVAVGSVQGAKGYVILQVAPQPTDSVRCTYYYHRGDTAFLDTVSDQVTKTYALLTAPAAEPYEIITDTSDTLLVSVDGGSSRSVTLVANPSATAAAIKSQVDQALIPGLEVAIVADAQGLNHLVFKAASSLTMLAGNANGPLGFTPGATTNRNRDFRVFERPIVDGTSGGLTTTDPTKVVVLVNGTQVVPSAVDGKNGIVTLPTAPPPNAVVTIQYFANTWQDTFDYLPNSLVTNVLRCGISANRSDYIQGQDFVVANPSADVSVVHWGASYSVSSGTRTAGAEPFDSTQIVPTLVDDKMYLAQCERVVDTSVVPSVVSDREFLLPAVPTLGNGRDTPIGLSLYNTISNNRQALASNRPDLVTVRVGRNLNDALNQPAAKVIAVDAANRKVTLKDPLPPGYLAFATFWYNRLSDDTYILTCKTPGAVGVGQYEIFSTGNNKSLYQVKWGGWVSGSDILQWPRGVQSIPDAFHTGDGTPVSETITVVFSSTSPTNAKFTNSNPEPYSFYGSTSYSWATQFDGTTPVATLLTGSAKAYLVGGHVPLASGKVTIPASPNNVLSLSIDGTQVNVTLTAGAQDPEDIVDEINAAIDAASAFHSTEPNLLVSKVEIGTDVVFILTSYSTPADLPGGFDSQAHVQILQGTVEGTLGFTTFQEAYGTTGAINKPATVVSSKAGPYNITTGLNDKLIFRINGTDYTATLPQGTAVTATQICGVINTLINDFNGTSGIVYASVGTLRNLEHVRLTSNVNTDVSSVLILSGSANDVLGFVANQVGSQVRVTAQEVCNRLMETSGFQAKGIAYPTYFQGQGTYITIEGITTGATASVAFLNSTNSAFNTACGTGIVPGTSGDNGEAAFDMFTVSSTNTTAGSSGVGYPGQTYTDARTGLRFTILPALDGHYSGSFKLFVSPTFDVNPAVPTYALPGLETLVYNTVSVGANDTATVQTFNPSGLEPANGDFYYISYRYMKQDFSTRIFRQFKNIEANYGRLSAENRVTLASYLEIMNGAVLVGVKQVLKVPNTNQANDQAFIQAISDLGTPLPGNIRPDVLVPLTTSTTIYSYLAQHCEIMSNWRNQSERMGMIGFASGTTPNNAQAIAKAISSNRIIAYYPDSAVITLTNEYGENFEIMVDGTYFAAAAAGWSVSPSIDVATPYTRRRLQGFTRIPRILDPVEANQTAVSGITLLEDLEPIIRIRQGLTTNMSSILTRLPTVTQIDDHVHQQSRANLDAFIGTKFTSTRTNEVEVTLTSLFKQLVQAEIVAAFTGITAAVDSEDGTIMRTEAFYQPVFPLLFILVSFNLRARV